MIRGIVVSAFYKKTLETECLNIAQGWSLFRIAQPRGLCTRGWGATCFGLFEGRTYFEVHKRGHVLELHKTLCALGRLWMHNHKVGDGVGLPKGAVLGHHAPLDKGYITYKFPNTYVCGICFSGF